METKVSGRLILFIAVQALGSIRNIVEIRIMDWMRALPGCENAKRDEILSTR